MATLSILSTIQRASRLFAGTEHVMDAVMPPLWLEDLDYENPEMVLRYLEAGGDVGVRLREGATILHKVAGRSTHSDAVVVDCVRALLEHGADADAADEHRWTPLMVAADAGRLGVVRALLARGADADATNRHGGTALMVASYAGHEGVADALRAAGADESLRDGAGHAAADWSDLRPQPSQGRRHR